MYILYHASVIKDLEVIRPQATLSNDINIGDYVFATSDMRIAAMYLITRGTPILINVEVDSPRVIIVADPTEYIKRDKGGAIYSVPAGSFIKSPQAGLEDSELVSQSIIKPLAKKVYATSLDAIKEMGIKIYFVSRIQFDEILHKKNESEVIAQLVPFGV